ncbi:M13 family metallopeptidase [Stakelama marina]|uniref:M13 family metallopeptidase n=1 Tax=Stakelama marina TaxID=2826939 RepID=A0A8T4ICI2_9SPHN|nr:M13 family metallopeptidase [Stakelama marina]MBR0551554.1 M13 family metallopeptidase [Stakelama marina]
MRRTLFVSTILAGSTLLASCATSTVADTPSAPLEKAAVSKVTPAPAPKPQIGQFGFDEAGMDKAVEPGNDFYEYANGTWQKDTVIPSDKSAYGLFTMLADLSQKRTHGILENVKNDPNSKIGVAYSTYLDRDAIDAKGLAPIDPWLNQIRGLKSKSGYAALVAQADRNGVRVPFGSYVGQDDKQPDIYAMNLYQGGTGLPDREYYLSKDAKFQKIRDQYVAHMAKMLTLAGEGNAQARAQAIMNLETGFAKAQWTRVESRDSNKTYNKLTLSDLQQKAPGFDFATYLKGIGANVDYVIVAQPSAVEGEAKLISNTPLSVLKDQLLVRSLEGFSDVLPKPFDDENFAFYGTVLSGTPEQQVRWKRAVDFTSGILSDDVSKIYVAKYFPPETKVAADKMVKNIIAAMDRRIDKLDWMAPQTKVKAHEKLAAFTPKIGYPDKWRDYSGLIIKPGDAFGNNLRANQWQHNYNINKLGKPIYRWEWGMTPMTVNAYANPGMVEIVFPAAILQPPFFDPNADPAVNYGGIGAVIGHELSHHFDDQGSKYNKEGRLVDWWTPADHKAFDARTNALVQEYDKYEPLPGKHVNGKLTLGENIADLAGLTVSHDAYMHSLNGKTPPVIDGYTADQRFYLGWAQVWRRKYREANLEQRLLTDPHSPSEQRTWVVRNLDPWYPAFDVTASQKLYLAPDQRVRIW